MEKFLCINTKPLDGNTIAPPLQENVLYPLIQTHTCTCGQQHFDVGLSSGINFVSCYTCKKELPKSNEFMRRDLKPGHIIHWCHPSRFKPE